MTVTDVRKDPAAASMAITAEFDAAADQVWQLWEDPRLLERWWGPPSYPATVVDHRKPHRGDPVTFWDTTRWQSLCKSCHDRKTATQDRGFGRAAGDGG